MTTPSTGVCRHCLAPVPLDGNGKVAAHKVQIVSARGWADGYESCKGKGWSPKPESDKE